jgi:hypothetical protein
MSSGEDESSIEAHVLARAYRAAWRATHATEPSGAHRIAALDLIILYGKSAPIRDGVSEAVGAPTASSFTSGAGARGERYDK